MVLCFVALFIQLNNIQIFKANSLANNPNNPQVLAVAAQPAPGRASSPSDGVTLAYVGAGPTNSIYKYQRVVQPLHGHPLLPDRRVRLHQLRQLPASRPSTTATSPPTPGRPRRCGTCWSTAPCTDNVTLTISSKLQSQVAQALDQHDARGPGRRPPWCSTDHRRHRGHVLQSHLRPQPAGVRGPEHGDDGVDIAACPPSANQAAESPLPCRGLRPARSARVDLQGGHHLGRAPEPSRPGHHDLSERVVDPPARLRHAAPGADQLPQRSLPPPGGQPRGRCSSSPATPTSPRSAQLLGAQTLVNQAQAYGFNQTHPPRRAVGHRGRLQLRDHGRLRRRRPRSDEVGHRPAERDRHRPCRWPWWPAPSPTVGWR